MAEAGPVESHTATQISQGFHEETFGEYRLTHLLGKGGMASVYRAVRSGPMGFAKQMAIKRLHSTLTDNDQVLKALINEARLGGQLKHPNIVEVYEFNKVETTYYLAMEFVDGWTLDRITKLSEEVGLPIPIEVVLDITAQICEGLHYAHTVESLDGQEVNLVHRDLKPANIILGRDGVAKVMDFGIAKAATNLFKTTLADTTKGTPHYMSPEQVAGAADLDATSDIFAMGSVLYELVTGEVLFTGESLVAVLFAVARADVDAAVARLDGVLPGLGGIVGRCLQKDPTDRYKTARDLRQALMRLRESCPGDDSIKSYLYALRERMLHGKPGIIDPDEEGPEFATLLAKDWVTVDARAREELAETKKAADKAVDELAANAVLGDGTPGLSLAETMEAPSQAGVPVPQAPGPAGISPKKATRPNLRPTRVYTKSDTAGQRTRRTVAMVSVALLLVIAGALAFIEFGPKDAATPDPTPLADAGVPPPEMGDLAVEATPTPAPRKTPKARRTPKSRATPTAAGTPAPQQTPVAAVADPPPPLATPTPEATPEAVAVLGRGTLLVKPCKPWARVFIDGKDSGKNTPVFDGIELSAGKHTIELRNFEKQARVSKTITIEPGKKLVLPGYDFEQKSWTK
jgi:serine/threonine protein kinase